MTCPHCEVMTQAVRAASKECDEWKVAYTSMKEALDDAAGELRSLRSPSNEDSLNAVVSNAEAVLAAAPPAGLQPMGAEEARKALAGLLALKQHWVWSELRHHVEPALVLLGAPTLEDRTAIALRGGKL